MKLKKRVSLTRSTRNRREKQSAQAVQVVEPTAKPADEARYDQNEWQWMESLEKAMVKWDFGGLDRAPEPEPAREESPTEMAREAAPAPEAAPEAAVVPERKKKRRIRPMFAALRQKLRRKPKPLLNLEEDAENTSQARTMKGDAKEQNNRQPLLTYEQWEQFMDTIAFPEKSKPVVAIKEYVASSRKKATANANTRSVSQNDVASSRKKATANANTRSISPKNDVVQEIDSASDAEDSNEDTTYYEDKMSLAEFLSTQSVDEESVQKMKETGITWEEFMDTVAFPEKILARKYNSLLTFIATNRVPPNEKAIASSNEKAIASPPNSPRGSLNKDDKYAFDDEEEDDIKLFSMEKDSPDEDLGISLTLLDGQKGIFVSHVARGSKAAASGLTTGMQIISINQDSCPADLEEAQFLLESVEDDVQIFAQPGETSGMVLQGIEAYAVGKSALSNLFNHVGGLLFENVDNDDFDDDLSDEGESLEEPAWDDGNGESVATVRQQWQTRDIQSKKTSPKLVYNQTKLFAIVKETKSEVVGVAFVQTQDLPGIFVNQIMPSSKFYGSGLRKGMRVVSINGQPCPSKIDALIRKLQTITGALELGVETAKDVAKDTLLEGDCFITATIIKRGGEDPGLMLRRDRFRGGIFVKNIDPYSDFVGTNLRPGLRVMSINGHECPKDVQDCMWEMQQVDGIFDIIAETVPEQRLRLD
mmetsp:Transcript_36199/g.87611  ORF Transcript_36199/g.87611 Transcript_36199/m.87611 type:complete len:705 (+) Transcript_36199:82-2196(+)